MKMPDMKNVDWKDVIIGDYDWAFLCTPRLPWTVAKRPPPFYGKDEPISVFVAFIMGLQHCLTMVRKGYQRGPRVASIVQYSVCGTVCILGAAFFAGLQHCLTMIRKWHKGL